MDEPKDYISDNLKRSANKIGRVTAIYKQTIHDRRDVSSSTAWSNIY